MTKCKEIDCSNNVLASGYCAKHYQRLRRSGVIASGTKPRGTTEERFWRFVEKKSDSECWIWVGHQAGNYGSFSIGARTLGTVLAHRFSWAMHNNQEIPSGMVIMHSCDNPLCVNPNHLSVGTHMENTHDMLKKGRHTYIAHVGEENGKSVLNAKIVKEIRESKMNHAELGRFYGVSTSCIRGVRTGRTWSHIT
jgi:hypothetical protein